MYTQANSHGEVAKIQPAWSSQRNHKLCAVMLTEFYIYQHILIGLITIYDLRIYEWANLAIWTMQVLIPLILIEIAQEEINLIGLLG